MKTSLRPNASRPLLAASLAVLLAFGCSDQGTEPPTSPVATPDLSARAGQSSASQQDLGPALAAQKRHGPQLMAIPGVVGHGVGVDDDGNPTITVFTLKPGVKGIPANLDDVPTRRVVSGQFVAGGLIDTDPPDDPVPNGYSIGHPDITAGTLGAVVQDAGGVCYILSNNHVLAKSNDASIGDSALQPGSFDGGSDPANAIAKLADFQVIAFDGLTTNTIDAAIAEVFTPVDENVSATGPHFTPTSTPVDAFVGEGDNAQDVKKTGRTTELTTGVVTEINVTSNVCYACGGGPFCRKCNKLAHYEGQIATTDMSEGGDSGSLLVDTSNNPVGLLFAGSSTRTIYNPIGPVLARFNFATVISDLASCTNGEGGGGDPTADFTFTTSGLMVDFTDQSTDDGSVVAWSWDFGGPGTGGPSTGPTPSWTYDAAGPYIVSLTVTDDDGATGTTSKDVTVSDGGTAPGVGLCTPDNGNPGDRLTVVVTGSDFQDGATADFGERVTVQGVTFESPSQLDVQIKVHRRAASGSRDVTVTNPDAQSGSKAGCFTVN